MHTDYRSSTLSSKTDEYLSGVGVQDVKKVFDQNLVALDRCSLTVSAHEVVALVGPSGCGKTTLLRIVAGLTPPTEGHAFLDGTELTRPGPERAVVFQEDSVFPWLTVRGNLEYGPRARGIEPRQYAREIDRLLKAVGLRDYEDLFPRQLSGGMKKRVDVARAYANDPKVLLMDEPFGALDYFTKERMQIDLLRLLADRPKAAIFITHDVEEAVFIADRVLVMSPRPGHIKADISSFTAREEDPRIKISSEFQRVRQEVLSVLDVGLDGGS